jgi:hypothetical protein
MIHDALVLAQNVRNLSSILVVSERCLAMDEEQAGLAIHAQRLGEMERPLSENFFMYSLFHGTLHNK